MMKMFSAQKNILFSTIALVAMAMMINSSCKKDEAVNTTPNPAISDTPHIDLKSATPTTVHNLTDSILFTVHYTDGDGDLGDYDADTLSLWVTDNRFPLTEKFHIQPLAPAGTNITISGDLIVVLPHIILEDQYATSETATFTIQVKDRAGHWSNAVTSGNITVVP